MPGGAVSFTASRHYRIVCQASDVDPILEGLLPNVVDNPRFR